MNNDSSTASAAMPIAGTTSTQPDMAAATATITFSGLSLLWFPASSLGANLGFFRHGHSPVNIEIRDRGNQLVYSTARQNGPFSSTVDSISLNADANGRGSKLFKNSSRDVRDFEETPALSGPKFYNHATALKNNLRPFSAIVDMRGGVLYTFKLSHSIANRFEIDQNGNRINKAPIGNLGKVFAMEVPRADLEVRVKDKNGISFSDVLRHHDQPYRIHIWVVPDGSMPTMSHFQFLYEVIDPHDPRVFDIEFEQIENEYFPFPPLPDREKHPEVGKIACQAFLI